MKILFAGTPEFARAALAHVLAAGFDVPLVLTQPDRPAGRGMKLQASPVKQLALERGIAVAQPRGLRLDGKYPDDAAAAREAIVAAQADAMVVAAYGLILPRWRGPAPIHRAIEAGDTQTGVTIMQMDEGLDTGAMLLREALPIRADDTTARLHDRLATLGGRLIVEALEIAACGGLRAEPQPAEGITYAHKIEKAEAAIDWSLPAAVIERRVRAFDPFPGASTALAGEAIKVWAAQLANGAVEPGSVLDVGDRGITVACGEQALRLTQLQRAGGKRLAAGEFLRGFPITPGQRLGAAA
jgi:methionyl-tRNA formyltransferase